MPYGLSDLHEAIKNSFPSPNYIYMREVRDATGFDAVRSADGIAVGMYRSCGREIHGFETKVTRQDWLKELSLPAKAESLMRYCHRWALVVPDHSIVHDGELPVTWGLGVPDRTRKNALLRIKWVVRPPELQPIPFSIVFITALLYAALKVDEPKRQADLREEYERGKRDTERDYSRKKAHEEVSQLRAAVIAFQKASGVQINQYTSEATAERLGASFAKYREAEGQIEGFASRLRWMHENAQNIVRDMGLGIERIQKGSTDAS